MAFVNFGIGDIVLPRTRAVRASGYDRPDSAVPTRRSPRRSVDAHDGQRAAARARFDTLDARSWAPARKVDVVVVAAFDRFGRSVRHLVENLFRHLGVDFISLREQIDTGSSIGQAVFTIVAAIAQLERSLIAERVRPGSGGRGPMGSGSGRPPLQVDERQLQPVLSQSLPVRLAAKALGISTSSYVRLARALGRSPAVCASGNRINETVQLST